jgi:hypothetical protein
MATRTVELAQPWREPLQPWRQPLCRITRHQKPGPAGLQQQAHPLRQQQAAKGRKRRAALAAAAATATAGTGGHGSGGIWGVHGGSRPQHGCGDARECLERATPRPGGTQGAHLRSANCMLHVLPAAPWQSPKPPLLPSALHNDTPCFHNPHPAGSSSLPAVMAAPASTCGASAARWRTRRQAQTLVSPSVATCGGRSCC